MKIDPKSATTLAMLALVPPDSQEDADRALNNPNLNAQSRQIALRLIGPAHRRRIRSRAHNGRHSSTPEIKKIAATIREWAKLNRIHAGSSSRRVVG